MGSISLKHSLDGRLRLKLSSVKNSRSTAQAVEKALMMLQAVTECKASPITGSVVIKYDATMATEETFLQFLKEQGFCYGVLLRNEHNAHSHTDSNDGIARIIFTKAVEVAAERAILALL